MAAMQGDYQFSAEPREIGYKQSAYRDLYADAYNPPPANLMFDRRIVRGNTYAAMVIPASTQQEMERQQELEHKRQARAQQRRIEETQKIQQELEASEPSERLRHMESQNLEQDLLEDIHEAPSGYRSQHFSEFFINRPPTPEFIPIQKGIDMQTQIEDDELFDFEVEVEPILQVLVGKSVEQGRMEVIEEDEIEELRQHQVAYEQVRDAELLEVQRLEAEEIRRQEETDRRNLQAMTRRAQMQLAHQKYCSRIMAKRFLSNNKRMAIKQLVDLGCFSSPHDLAWHDQLLPWLYEEVMHHLSFDDEASDAITQAADSGSNWVVDKHKAALKRDQDRKDAIEAEKVRVQNETEERKKQRAEMRVLRQAWQEKMAFKEQIQDTIVFRGEWKDHITEQPFSDIDSRSTVPVIGTPGGIVGELINFLQSLEEHQEEELTADKIKNILTHYVKNWLKSEAIFLNNIGQAKLNELLETVSEIETEKKKSEYAMALEAKRKEKDDARLKLMDERRKYAEEHPDEEQEELPEEEESAEEEQPDLQQTITLETISTVSEESRNTILAFLLNRTNHMNGTTLSILWDNLGAFKIREELLINILSTLFGFALQPEDEFGVLPVTAAKTRIQPQDDEFERQEQAVVRIRIPLVKKELKPEGSDASDAETQKKDLDESALISESPEPVKPYLVVESTEGMVEVEDLEDKVLMVTPNIGDLQVFVIHQSAQRFLRKEFSQAVRQMREFDRINVETLNEKVQKRAQDTEDFVMAAQARDLTVFNFEFN